MDEFIAYGSSTELPTIHVISDSVGLTAQAVARAAAAQFGVTNPVIEVLPKVRTFEEIKEFMDEHSAVHKRNTGDGRMLVSTRSSIATSRVSWPNTPAGATTSWRSTS